MSFSVSHGKPLDTTGVGLDHNDLPTLTNIPDDSRFNMRTLWPNDQSDKNIQLEIGSGKGTFLVQQATQSPNVNYIGIEYARKFYEYAADRCRRHNLTNVRIINYDAKVFVKWYCPDNSFKQIHIYFPDPWPKKKQHKRRMVQSDFLTELHRVLYPQGQIHIVTDHADYFTAMEQHVKKVAHIFIQSQFRSPSIQNTNEIVGTNFERKYRLQNRAFNAMTLTKL